MEVMFLIRTQAPMENQFDFVHFNSTYYKWNSTNCWHEEILTSVGRITVLFSCECIFLILSQYFIHTLCFPNTDLQKKFAWTMMNIMWPRYLIQAKSYISSDSNVRFFLIVSTKMYRNASVKEQKYNFVSEALVTVSEINDFKQGGFIALEIFFINNNSYMNEMRTDWVVFEGVRVELLVVEGVQVKFLVLKGWGWAERTKDWRKTNAVASRFWDRRQRSQIFRLLSQGRTAFAPRFYEIKERHLTLCACQLKGKQFWRSAIEVKDEQLPVSIKTEYGREMAYNATNERKGRMEVDTLDLDWSAQLLCMTFTWSKVQMLRVMGVRK